MTRILIFVLTIVFSSGVNAQDDALISKAVTIPEANCTSAEALGGYIKEHFDSDTNRLRAIYIWVTNHISYDVNQLQPLPDKLQRPPQTVPDVLKTRSAVCQGYADLFNALCKNAGLISRVVTGYVKQHGKVSPVGHAWIAVEINGEWLLVDPTWGAGYLDDKGRFVKHFNNAFYKVQPPNFIADHMPFDPLYQFLSNTLNNREFIDGKVPSPGKKFNYKDSLARYNKLSAFEQMNSELRRLEEAGIENDLLNEHRKILKTNLQLHASNSTVMDAGTQFNTAVDLLNKYYGFKNKQFTAIEDKDLLQFVDSLKNCTILARSLMVATVTQTEEHQAIKRNNLATMDKFWATLMEEERFVQQYIGTDKTRRIELFLKR